MRIVYVRIPKLNAAGHQMFEEMEGEHATLDNEKIERNPAFIDVQCEEIHWGPKLIDTEIEIGGEIYTQKQMETVVWLRRIDTNEIIYVDPTALEYARGGYKTVGQFLLESKEELKKKGLLNSELLKWFDGKIKEYGVK